ncbi:MAG: ribonuclease HII [Oscillospiraceae bacterium]|jgi:ribonuclease HII|nr:ribonuclease HII [Oscillospiraceae bacterium]
MRLSAAEKLRQIVARDQALWAQGLVFAGIDEAGRGPLAGPVVAGCAVMPPEPLIEGVNDSKKLSEAKREALYGQIVQTALFARTGVATVEEIARLGILGATRLAMARAAEGAPCALFLVDGNDTMGLSGEVLPIIGGDASCYSIAAASILAKVERDALMRALDAQYPGYGFAVHKGYGTPAHIEALRARGACPAHRALFLRKILGEQA